MLCDIFNFWPCFVVVTRVGLNHTLPLGGPIIGEDKFTCAEKCDQLGRVIPSFTTVIQRNRTDLLLQCDPKKPCSFPINVSFDHSAKVWRDGTSGKVVSLPWKQSDNTETYYDEWLYPKMNDQVWVQHGIEWTVATNGDYKPVIKYAVTDAVDCSYKPNHCPIKKFWCSKVTRASETASGPTPTALEDTFSNAVEHCKRQGATILTISLNSELSATLKRGESAWTGSIRFNE